MKKNVHRRDFLKLSLAAAAAPLGVEALAAEKPPAAHSHEVTIGQFHFHLPCLRIPGGKTTLHVAEVLSDEINRRVGDGPNCILKQWDAKGDISFGRLAPAMAADGTAMEKGRQLIAVVPPRQGDEDAHFPLLTCKSEKSENDFRFTALDDKSLKLTDGDQPVLVYNHGTIIDEKVPAKDHRRSRACYVHPLWGLNGEVLTDDFPKDHYHHHGVFWTWPHVSIDGKQHSLWDGNTIHDRSVRWIARDAGEAAAVLAVENGWFVGEEKVMIERVWMRVFRATDEGRAIDFDFTWIPVDKPITLRGAEGKSYGGLTVRFAAGPRGETLITVPSGPTQEDLPDTKLAWADFTSKFAGAKARSGAAIFVHPNHPDYPPTWLTRNYGAMCVGWPGVKPKTFEPGKPIRLSYRLWIHKGPADVEQLKRAYAEYGEKKKVEWE